MGTRLLAKPHKKNKQVININGIKWLVVFCDVISRSIIIKYNSSSTNKQNFIYANTNNICTLTNQYNTFVNY